MRARADLTDQNRIVLQGIALPGRRRERPRRPRREPEAATCFYDRLRAILAYAIETGTGRIFTGKIRVDQSDFHCLPVGEGAQGVARTRLASKSMTYVIAR